MGSANGGASGCQGVGIRVFRFIARISFVGGFYILAKGVM